MDSELSHVRDDSHILISGGQDELKGKIFRTGHMGDCGIERLRARYRRSVRRWRNSGSPALQACPPPATSSPDTRRSRMHKILVCDPLSEAGLDILRLAGEVSVRLNLDGRELAEAGADAAAIVVRSSTRIDGPVIEAAPQLMVIARAGVGVDNIDVATATRCGVLVVNPLGNTLAAAEHRPDACRGTAYPAGGSSDEEW